MATSVSDFIIDRLIAWDLHQWYGYPGDGIGGFDGAMGRAQDEGKDFRYVRPTHEEEAAFMATAHAKFTGEVGAVRSRRRNPRRDIISHLLEQGYNQADILVECVTYGTAGMVTTREFITMAC